MWVWLCHAVLISTNIFLWIDCQLLRLDKCGKFDVNFNIVHDGNKLQANVLNTHINTNIKKCIKYCALERLCDSINHHISGTCELLEVSSTETNLLQDNPGWTNYQSEKNDTQVGEICREMNPCLGHRCEEICEYPGFKCLDTGFSKETSVLSCKALKTMFPTYKSGFYWLKLEGDTFRAFCDMETDGGGWLLTGNITITDSDGTGQGYRNVTSSHLQSLDVVTSTSTLLSMDTLNRLRNEMNFTQIRFKCEKESHGRRFHIMTAQNSTGYQAVDVLLGVTNKSPPSCGSYITMTDDTSILSYTCNQWDNGFFTLSDASGMALKEASVRLYDHLVVDPNGRVVQVNDNIVNRFECDDNYGYGNDFGRNGYWLYYVR